MSRTIDERVVEMRFDNKQFESGAKQTMGTLSRLKEALKLPGITKSFDDLQKAANRVDMSGLGNVIEGVKVKFSALEVAAVTALSNIVNRAVDAGVQLAKSLSVDQIFAGFNEYELKMNSIQTIMASTGESLDTVNGYLEELNRYSDKTIYSFSDMTQNIGKFTNAGVKLEDAVKAIQGVSNAAAVSGSNAQQASHAMYNFAQALSSGSVKLIDWVSIDKTAGMGTVEFKQSLIDTAVAMGTVVKEGNKYKSTTTDLKGKISDAFDATSMFNDSLSHQWLTTDVLVQTLNNYSHDVREMSASEKKAYEEKLRSIGYTEDQIKSIEELGIKAFDSAQDVKTLTQLIDTMRETVGSGWAQTFELIFGDFEEAKKLWTNVNNTLGAVLKESSDSRNELLKQWKDLGGRTALFDGISNSFKALVSIAKALKSAFREIFPKITADQLVSVTNRFRDLTSKLILSEEASDKLKRTFSGLFSIIDIIGQAAGAFFRLIIPGVSTVKDLSGGILDVTASIGDWITNLDKAIKENGLFIDAVEKIRDVSKRAFLTINTFANDAFEKFKTLFGLEDMNLDEILDNISNAFQELSITIDDFSFQNVEESFDSLKKKIKSFTDLLMSNEGIFTFVTNFKKFGEDLKEAFTLDNLLDRLERVMDVFGKFFNWIKTTMAPAFKDLNIGSVAAAGGGFGIIYGIIKATNAFDKVASSIKSIPDLLGGVKDTLSAYQKELKADAILKISAAIAVLAGALVLLSFADTERLLKASAAFGIVATALSFGIAKLLNAINKGKELNNALSIFTRGLSSTMKKFGRAVEIKALGSSVKDFAKSIAVIAASVIALGYMYNKDKDALLAGVELTKQIGLSLVAIGSLMMLASELGNLTKGMKDVSDSILKFTISIGIIVLAVSKLMKIELPTDYGTKLAILGGIFAGLGALALVLGGAARIAGGNELPKMAKTLTSLAILLGATVLSLKTLFEIQLPDDYGTKLAILGGIFVGFGALLIAMAGAAKLAGGNSFKAAGTILSMAAFLVVVVGSLMVLTIIPSDKMLKGAVGLGAVLLALGGALAGAGKISDKNTYKSVIAMAIAVGAITASLAILSMVPWEKLLTSAGALGAVLLALAVNFASLSKVKAKDSLPSVIAMVAATVSIAYSLYRLAEQPWDSLLAAAGALSATLIALTGCLTIASKAKVNITAIAAVVAGSASLLLVAESISVLAKYDGQQLLNSCLALSAMLLVMTGVMAACAALSGVASMAMTGVLQLGIVIAELAVVLAAIGALAQIPGLKWLIGEGGDLLQNIGTAIGQFVGGIVGGVMGGVASSLPEIGKNLSDFMDSLKNFAEGSKSFDGEVLKSVGILAACIVAITAAEVIAGIGAFLGGAMGLVSVASNLVLFIKTLDPFLRAIKDLKPDTVMAAKNLAEMIIVLTAADLLSGIGRILGFSGSFVEFGKQLKEFGPYIKQFSKTVEDIEPKAVQGAASAAEIMANLSKKLPATGSLGEKIFGSRSLSAFGTELLLFGPRIKQFSKTVEDIEPKAVQGAASAAEIMSNLATKLPPQRGLSQKLFGERSLSVFGTELLKFGPDIKIFGKIVEDVTPKAVQGAASAAEIMATLSTKLPSTETLWNKIFGGGKTTLSGFGTELIKFGNSMTDFAGSVDTLNVDQINGAISSFKSLVDLANYMQDASATGMVSFSNQLSQIGVDSVNKFVQAFIDAGPKATSAVNNLFNSVVAALNAGGIRVQSVSTFVGNTLGNGLQTGINQTRPRVISTETNLAISMINTMRSSLPISTFSLIGQNTANGVSNGINAGRGSVTSAASSLGYSATNAARSTLTYGSFYGIGSNAASGLSGGISSRIGEIASSAISAARAAINAAKSALQEHSPSRVFREIGENVSLGMSGGILNKVSNVSNASHDLASTAIDTVRSAVKEISDEIENSESVYTPTISPVIDLSNVSNAANQVSSAFHGLDLSTTMGLAQTVSYDFNRNRLKSFDKEDHNNRSIEKKLDQFIKDNGESTKIENTNTFYIQSTDPKQAAEEVGYIMQHKVERGKAVWA